MRRRRFLRQAATGLLAGAVTSPALAQSNPLAAKSEDFKNIYASWRKFLADSNLWFRIAESNLDSYRYIMSAQR